MSAKTETLDVRPHIREGREPFSAIMNAVDALGPEDQLLLIAPFQPVPLYRVMAGKGFKHEVRPTESGDWRVLFFRDAAQWPVDDASQCGCGCHQEKIIEVDARGLEPPQPLVSILEAVESAPADAEIRARTDRRPMHLYPALEQRGFSAETTEQRDGSFLTAIRRS